VVQTTTRIRVHSWFNPAPAFVFIRGSKPPPHSCSFVSIRGSNHPRIRVHSWFPRHPRTPVRGSPLYRHGQQDLLILRVLWVP